MYVHVCTIIYDIIHFTVLQLQDLESRRQYTGKYLRPAGQDAQSVQASYCVMCAIVHTSDLAAGTQQHVA